MDGDNFVEQVHAYLKWLLRLETEDERDVEEAQSVLEV